MGKNPRLALFTPKQEGCPEETGNTKKSSFPHTPDAAARTPLRLKVCRGSWRGPLPPGELSNWRGLFLKQGCTPTHYRAVSDAHNQSLTPIITRGGQRNVHEGPS